MSWRRVLAYWALAIVVGVQLFWTVGVRGVSIEAQAPVAAPIVEASAGSVDAVRIETAAGVLTFRRDQDRWVLDSPPDAEVSSDLVRALLETLTTLPPVEVLAEESTSLPEYGLEPPHAVLQFGASGERVAGIAIGNRNPTRTAVYARRLDGERLYLLGLNAQYYVDLLYEQVTASSGSPQ